MLALSTSCLAPEEPGLGVDERIGELLAHDVEGFELGVRIPAVEIEEFGRGIRGGGRRVTSLAAPCPTPRGLRPADAEGEPLLLTAEDATMRGRAVGVALDTLEWAARLEAPVVVVRCGRTAVEFPERRVRELHAAGRWLPGEGEGILRRLAAERGPAAARALDLLRLSLDRILVAADRLEVSVALINRSFPHEIPNAAEFAPLLATFRGARLGTWFDSGAARVQETLGLAAPGETWEAMRGDLLGCRVHDVRRLEEGLPPGEGEIELGERLRGLPEPLPLVIEGRPGLGRERIARGIAHLRGALSDEGGKGNAPADPFLLG